MKIALVSFEFGEYCINLGNALAEQSDVLLLLARQQAEPYLDKLSHSVRTCLFNKPRLRHPLAQMQTISLILRQINQFHPDVVHVQHGHLWFSLALPLLRAYPLVVTVHDPRHHTGDHESQRTPQTIMNFGYRRADEIIVHGEQLKQEVRENLGIAESLIHVMPMVGLGDDDSAPFVPTEEHTILFFGRIWEYKGLDYLIRAEPEITACLPDARIVIGGQGEDFTRYRNMMAHPEHFEVHNDYISDAMRAELFQRASVVVLPYVDASQSAVVPVAYSFGKPVVATTVVANLDDDGIGGRLEVHLHIGRLGMRRDVA